MTELPAESAAARGLAVCHVCGLASPVSAQRCPRCRDSLHLRNRESLQRTWAFTLASLLLYFPANLLPILRVESFAGPQSSTIMGTHTLAGVLPNATFSFTVATTGGATTVSWTVTRRLPSTCARLRPSTYSTARKKRPSVSPSNRCGSVQD